MNPFSRSDFMSECIDNCLDCHRKCLETLNYSLSLHKGLDPNDHIQLLKNCSALCVISAQFMISRSDLHPVVCEACAKVCAACASSCEEFKGDDILWECAEVCHQCEASCREMANFDNPSYFPSQEPHPAL